MLTSPDKEAVDSMALLCFAPLVCSWPCIASRSIVFSLSASRELHSLRDPVNLRSEEHTSELQSHLNLVCRLLLEKKKQIAPVALSHAARAAVQRLVREHIVKLI